MPGFGVILAAEFLAATGGDISAFNSVDRVAGVSGLAPAPRDSGRISGNLKRPRRYDRRLLRACYIAALISIRSDTASRTYYSRKRSEGKTPHPSRLGPGPPTPQRPVGHAARQHPLSTHRT
jgi:transposase